MNSGCSTIEMPLVLVLARMEAAGIGVEPRSRTSKNSARPCGTSWPTSNGAFTPRRESSFNINSTGQMREILFDRLGLPVLKKTPKGAPSTDASVLEKLADAHPIVTDILEYRELEKLRSTYVDEYLPLVTADGRIHTRFNQLAATTGRSVSTGPTCKTSRSVPSGARPSVKHLSLALIGVS